MTCAFVTLLTSDNYLPGALVLYQSLRASGTTHDIVILVTEQVTSTAIQILERHFTIVIRVGLVKSTEHANLRLLGRPDLDVTYTKVCCFDPNIMKNSTGSTYEKIAFLDADTLVLQPIDTIFSFVGGNVMFAAASDCGWPDTFNSGVFVAQPSRTLYEGLLEIAQSTGSFDGGDQGLLNEFFSNWSTSRTKNNYQIARLPFVYNVTPSLSYAYLPAYNRFKSEIKIIHFIGHGKPWRWNKGINGLWYFAGQESEQIREFIDRWWAMFNSHRLYEQLDNLILERNWSKVVCTNQYLPHQGESSYRAVFPGSTIQYTISNNGQKQFGLEDRDFNWKEADIGKSALQNGLKVKSRKSSDELKQLREKPGLHFSVSNPPKVKRSTASTESSPDKPSIPTTTSPRETNSPHQSLFSSGSVYNIHEATATPANLEKYEVRWDQQEKSTSSTNLDADPPKKPLKTDEFTITPDGKITYHK